MVLAMLAAPVSATTLSFAAPAPAVQVGDTFTLDVLVADAPDLYAFQFDIAFDPAIVQANTVQEGDFLSAGGRATFFLPGTIDNSAGTVSFTANTLAGPGPGVSGDGLIVHLSFHALAAGQSSLSFGNVVLLDSALMEVATTHMAGAISVASVPEPASVALFGIGLAVLTAGARRRGRHTLPNPDRT
ncbi:hypothetical protein ASC95_07210 [Pelomonas sp. Root1217]|nr:hypothetical protein ASC95_07210 [Pelomonas sp. Root1217]